MRAAEVPEYAREAILGHTRTYEAPGGALTTLHRYVATIPVPALPLPARNTQQAA
jgi:hypothetical protein